MFDRRLIKAGLLLVVVDTSTHECFNMTVIPGHNGDLACCCPGKQWFPLANFDVDLTYFDIKIIEIYGYSNNANVLDNETAGRVCLWKRPAQKMTLAEIENILGYSIEIISEKSENAHENV